MVGSSGAALVTRISPTHLVAIASPGLECRGDPAPAKRSGGAHLSPGPGKPRLWGAVPGLGPLVSPAISPCCWRRPGSASSHMNTMLPTLGLLLGCQLFGEVTARGLDLPVPGPVIGLAALVAIFWVRPRIARQAKATVAVILANLALFFVPAGVGVVGNLAVLSEDWLALLVVLTVSTWLAMLAAVATFIGVSRLRPEPPG